MTVRSILPTLFLPIPILLSACNIPANANHAQDPAVSDSIPVEGVVRVTGAQPVSTEVEIRAEDATFRVDGPLRDEMQALSGVTVQAFGSTEDGRMHVERYRVVSVDGRPAVSGIITREAGTVWLETDEGHRVRLHGAPDTFRDGDRVWVEGEPRTELDVRAYGRIRGQE